MSQALSKIRPPSVSPGTFKKLVRLGLAPPPLELPGLDRNVFDRFQLDRAMDAARQTEAA